MKLLSSISSGWTPRLDVVDHFGGGGKYSSCCKSKCTVNEDPTVVKEKLSVSLSGQIVYRTLLLLALNFFLNE